MDKTITLTFPASIYDQAVIKQAVMDYSGICRISITESRNGVSCMFSDSITDITLTAHEFSNYLIELSNTRSKS